MSKDDVLWSRLQSSDGIRMHIAERCQWGNAPEIRVGIRNLVQIPRFLIQPVCFWSSLALLGALTVAENVGHGSLNVPFNDPKLLWPNCQDITHVHVTDLGPFVFTKVCRFRQPAVFAPHFDDAAALGHLGAVVALLGDVSSGPQPERPDTPVYRDS